MNEIAKFDSSSFYHLRFQSIDRFKLVSFYPGSNGGPYCPIRLPFSIRVLIVKSEQASPRAPEAL